MAVVEETGATVAAAPRPGGGPLQSNPVRSYRSDCTSPRIRDRRPNALKEQVK